VVPPRTPPYPMTAFQPPVARRGINDTLDRVLRATTTWTPTSRELSVDRLSDETLGKFWPSERRAIIVHQFYLGLEQRRDVPIEEAIQSWEDGPCHEWRRKKMRRDIDAQEREIERHKYLMSEQAGRDVGWEVAAADWLTHYGAAWRKWWEERPESGA